MMLYFKNMVSLRCKLYVKDELDKRGLAAWGTYRGNSKK
jgi:hypothetical protein